MGTIEIMAVLIALAGAIFSLVVNVVQKLELNIKMKSILPQKRLDIERKLLEIKEIKLDLNKEIMVLRDQFDVLRDQSDQFEYKKLEVSEKELDIIQEFFKYEFLNELDKKEKELLNESLEQKYLSGQVDYLNKLLDLSGTKKSIKLKPATNNKD